MQIDYFFHGTKKKNLFYCIQEKYIYATRDAILSRQYYYYCYNIQSSTILVSGDDMKEDTHKKTKVRYREMHGIDR